MAILGSARVSRAGFGVAPKRTFLSLSGWLDRVGERSPRWRGGYRQHAGRMCSPEYRALKLQGNALLELASDGFGLLRYIQSRGWLHEFISHNTASTRARLGENSHTGSVSAAFPVSNAA